MGKRKPQPSYTPPPRQGEVWEYPLPETENVIQEGDAPLERLIAGLESMAEDSDIDGPTHDRLVSVLSYAHQLKKQAYEGSREVDALRDHAQALNNACADLADRVSEADEIRDAIERHPGTAPGVWRDALRIARSGGPVRDMWAGGES